MSTEPAGEHLPVIVVPCFNEERRIDVPRFTSLAESGRVRLLFVNDGSTDDTVQVLTHLVASASNVDILDLPHNGGKAEAVRRGLLQAVESGTAVVGYYDADMSTPPHELLRLLAVLDDRPQVSFVMGARVQLLGRTIERSTLRHYLGRVFATLASVILRIRVYDTQCGAKVFRVTPAVREALERRFRSSWVFDVELIGRLLEGGSGAPPLTVTGFEEVPLVEWHHVSGSKLTISEMARAFVDLLVVGARLSLLRRPHRGAS